MTDIIIVEDQTSDAMLLEETLCASGYRVLGTAGSGEEAVAMARQLKPQVMLMDIVLPGELDGIDAAIQIRSDLDVPIVFLTGYAEEELLHRAKDMGAHGYILKPYHANQVKAAVEVALYKNALEKELKAAHKQSEKVVKERTEHLLETKEQLEALINATTDTALLIDLDGQVIASNRVTAKRFGVSLEAFIGTNIYDLMPPELAQSRRSKAEKVIETGTPCRFEDNRAGLVFDSSIYPVYDHQGRVVQLTIYGRNITKERQTEVSLRHSEARYRRLLDTMNEGFRMLDTDMRITYANTRLCDMLGHEREDLIGRFATDFLDQKNRAILKTHFEKRRHAESGSYELAMTAKDGRQVHTLVSSTPDVDSQGRFRGSSAVLTDISGLKATQTALKEKEKLLEHRTRELEETNAALKVLLQRREQDRNDLEEQVLTNVNELVSPYVETLKQHLPTGKEKALVEIVQANLQDIVSPLSRKLTSEYVSLTPKEIRVADLIKKEKTTKEIADIMGVSIKTVEYHRDNIRKKFGIKKEKVNLRSHLISLSQAHFPGE